MADPHQEASTAVVSFFQSRQLDPVKGLQQSIETKVNLFRDLAAGGQLSDDWIDYIAELIRRDMAGRRGKKPNANWLRDTAIAEAVYLAKSFGLNPTKNEATEGTSACSLVAGILKMEEGTVRKIWTRQGARIGLRDPRPRVGK